ncbi:Site-specific recombinase, phage integrase family protein [Shewanella benthica]|uniref:Site-specific recombinase, phage integrase family protein n=1 Tax=Shewanella benthica TaxID=43661 RepID=A0A330M373_9GAMM|nr:site-specific integrase [Shewanella benthica]SQH76641.1 Site-specific recombinase, phage integrase family protein [Shewanella benthica]
MHMPPVLPLFESAKFIEEGNSVVNQYITQISLDQVSDAGLIYEHASELLYEQQHNENSYKAYRSELTTFFHWCFDVVKQSPAALTRREIARYLAYCQNPPQELIGYFNVAQFKLDKAEGQRVPNVAWRPFVGKKAMGKALPYLLSENALKTKIAILSSFYSYLMSEDYCERNPAQAWMNHSRFSSKKKYRVNPDDSNMLAFTELQWSYVIATVEKLAIEAPDIHQRSLFMIKLVYSCYLRVSEVGARAGYSPVMSQFRQDQQTGIWSFHIPLSKGGKRRSVAISKALLAGLVEYRQFLKLPDYPSSGEQHPLLIRRKAAGRGREAGTLNANLGIRQIRDEVGKIIEHAANAAENDGFKEDAKQMRNLSVHNIRHTGITHDININGRPLSHVQADAGHESIDTTSQYLHTSQIERHQSAQNKPLDHLQGIG